ncbi:MAG: hypothetical protein HEP71_03270 [Roseivirga sp.]|nr:hypothetical protein [Roseivirga sp.]
MTEDELRKKKLLLEIEELSKPSWKKPAYLTIIVSAITILITAMIGFGQYYDKVDKDNQRRVEELEKVISENKDQQHKMEIATAKYETLIAQSARDSMLNSNEALRLEIIAEQGKLRKIQSDILAREKELQKVKGDYADFKSQVVGILDQYKRYSQGFANGVIRSDEGKEKIEEIRQIANPELQRSEIGRFAYTVTQQTYTQARERILTGLGLQ